MVVKTADNPHFDGSVFGEFERRSAKGRIRGQETEVLFKDEMGKSWRLDFSELPPA